MLAAVGMSACFGAVARAPVAAALMVFEMTHQFALVPALMLGAVIGQAVARMAAPMNFYDALLAQDHCDIHRLRPPRDLRDWQQQPVRALVNPRPVCCADTDPAALRLLLARHPYARFPLLQPGQPPAVLLRTDIEQALRADRPPGPRPAATCPPDATLRQAEVRFLETDAGMLLVLEPDGRLLGVLTLHDLLRAQVAALE